MKKRYLIILIIGILVVLSSGCEKKENKGEGNNSKVMVHEHCVRAATLEGGEASLNYELYYTGEKLNRLEAQETVTSSSSSLLDTYEEAYRSIHQNYKNLKYYETDLIRNETSVTSRMIIDYDRINLEQLLQIEGEEDNIVENGIPKVEKWKELAKKLGATCTEVANS
jgi:uncharacterized lipoprotein YehR (DUF1307 family)